MDVLTPELGAPVLTSTDPFATLGLERSYAQDLRAVEKTHRELSRALHPDRHAAGGASERRDSLNKAVLVNEAWRVVRDPIRRAEALFTLAGVLVGDTHEPKPTAALLMDMMELREELAEVRAARDAERLRRLMAQITERETAVQAALGAGFIDAHGAKEKLVLLVPQLGELRYYRRFLEEASSIEDELLTP
jgi:molecular chaperone HscB